MTSKSTFGPDHDILTINVRGSTQINAKATAAIAKLRTTSDGKTHLVTLQAQAHAANKMISIVEIAKRELKSEGITVFQYTTLDSKMTTIERRKTPADELDSDDAFEAVDPSKKRAVPLVTIYLCRQTVPELRQHV